MMKKRCKWVNLDNSLYVKYHDEEWGVIKKDDRYLFELLILEMFQAGLSWECILNKRENFKIAFDNFDYHKISHYNEQKITELMNNEKIIRNRLKIQATVNNAKIFINIQEEYGSFAKYIWSFTDNKVIKNYDNKLRTTSVLSDSIAKDLKKKGMKFIGSTIIYSYLQAIGVIDDHELECYKY